MVTFDLDQSPAVRDLVPTKKLRAGSFSTDRIALDRNTGSARTTPSRVRRGFKTCAVVDGGVFDGLSEGHKAKNAVHVDLRFHLCCLVVQDHGRCILIMQKRNHPPGMKT